MGNFPSIHTKKRKRGLGFFVMEIENERGGRGLFGVQIALGWTYLIMKKSIF